MLSFLRHLISEIKYFLQKDIFLPPMGDSVSQDCNKRKFNSSSLLPFKVSTTMEEKTTCNEQCSLVDILKSWVLG